jgi:hypothetical protein
MESDLTAALSAAHAEMMAEMTAKHPDHRYITTRNLGELTGVPDICDEPPTTWRNGTLALVRFGHQHHLEREHRIDLYGGLDSQYESIVKAASWLQESSQRRVITDKISGETFAAMTLVTVATCCDIRAWQTSAVPDCLGPLPDQVLHDVLSSLHGRDRRVAGLACRAWRRAACDFQLPVTADDVRAWFAPNLVEMKRAVPHSSPTVMDVQKLWMMTKRWLQSCP